MWQAPVSRALPHLALNDARFKVASFSDILYFVGYGHLDLLTPLVRAWEHLFQAVKPDLVICDFAPTVTLAARGGVPVIAIGDGFSQPPSAAADFPVLREEAEPQIEPAIILDVVTRLQKARGRAVPAHLPSIVAGDREFVCILPEFDPMPAPCRAARWGRSAPCRRCCPAPPGNEVFLYLSGSYESWTRSRRACPRRVPPASLHPQRLPQGGRQLPRRRHHGAVGGAAAPGLPRGGRPRAASSTMAASAPARTCWRWAGRRSWRRPASSSS